ncbi:hypothetical protein H7J06_03350 [Mycobacterium hodleri]|uniref:hypothetical protein n=1 Tax=Mycolicibacterium hodleri TaxID=49897 RepID=UPI000B1DB327|nr:hypothetical protein [Mycolicibacterium hodleri]MCV7132008.1 hypothetical protein [Mycolicibacterium hodleri]
MRITAKRIVPGLAVGFVAAAMALAPVAGADTSPLLPFGTMPQVKTNLNLQTSNHDELDTTNGSLDLPF